jgi:hypothetical protein
LPILPKYGRRNPGRSIKYGEASRYQQSTYSDQDSLALEVNLGDGKLAGQRHIGCVLGGIS